MPTCRVAKNYNDEDGDVQFNTAEDIELISRAYSFRVPAGTIKLIEWINGTRVRIVAELSNGQRVEVYNGDEW